jgi:hypothetical protein
VTVAIIVPLVGNRSPSPGHRGHSLLSGVDGKSLTPWTGGSDDERLKMPGLAATWMMEIAQDRMRFAREPFQYVMRPTLMIRRTCGAVR